MEKKTKTCRQSMEIKLDELAYLLNRDELDKFNRAAERYRAAEEGKKN